MIFLLVFLLIGFTYLIASREFAGARRALVLVYVFAVVGAFVSTLNFQPGAAFFVQAAAVAVGIGVFQQPVSKP